MNKHLPRGKCLTRNGKVLVDNASKMAITYTHKNNTIGNVESIKSYQS